MSSCLSRCLAGLVLTAAFALAPTVARADAVPSPPTDCPDGTEPLTCHGTPYCQPITCTSNVDCGTDQTCESQSFCLGTSQCFGGFSVDGGGPNTYTETNAASACAGSVECDGGACTSLKVCITSVGVSIPITDSSGGNGCSCRLDRGGPAWVALSAITVACGVFALRRRQRPSSQRRA